MDSTAKAKTWIAITILDIITSKITMAIYYVVVVTIMIIIINIVIIIIIIIIVIIIIIIEVGGVFVDVHVTCHTADGRHDDKHYVIAIPLTLITAKIIAIINNVIIFVIIIIIVIVIIITIIIKIESIE